MLVASSPLLFSMVDGAGAWGYTGHLSGPWGRGGGMLAGTVLAPGVLPPPAHCGAAGRSTKGMEVFCFWDPAARKKPKDS